MRATTLLATLALSLPASAANVYVLSSGDAATDNAVMAALASRGHTCTLGVQFFNLNGTQPLASFQTIYLQANNNWWAGEISATGAQALIGWVNAGGRLVTSEWVTYYSSPQEAFDRIHTILPLVQTTNYGNATSTLYAQSTPDPAINAGLLTGLEFNLTNYTGTEIHTTAKAGATLYYWSRSPSIAGLVGWNRGSGKVFSFSTTCGPDQLADPAFRRLFCNVMGESTPPQPCYANCDNSTAAPVLNVNDFSCFLNKFAAGSSAANCDASTAPPVLNVNDFSCFLNRFAAGCI